MSYDYCYDSRIGRIILSSNGTKLTGLSFYDSRGLGTKALHWCTGKDPLVFEKTIKWLDIYFSGREPDFMPSLFIDTTPFRKAVWDILLTIPYGKTMTYSQIADKIARKRGIERMSAQAVGGAVGHNPIAVIIPCHRVIGKNGSLTGYAWGIDKKEYLLQLEKADMERKS